MSDKKEAEDSSLTLKPKAQTNGQIRRRGEGRGWPEHSKDNGWSNAFRDDGWQINLTKKGMEGRGMKEKRRGIEASGL